MSRHGAGGAHPLDRGRVVATAIAMIDADGVDALSMRKLGAELGVQAMAVYHYFSGRSELLDGIVEAVVDELRTDPDLELRPGQWREYLFRLAFGVRRIAMTHPKLFPLIATRPLQAPWVRPPLRSLSWMESFLQTLQQCGFSDERSIQAYQTFSSFLLGHLLLEVAALSADAGPVKQPEPGTRATSDLHGYPLLQRLAPLLSRDRAADQFQDALELLIQQLDTDG